MRFDTNTDNIRHGLLFPYNSSAGIYRCPSDKSSPETPDGVKLPVPKTRSYNLSNSINGHNTSPSVILRAPYFEKESEIHGPGPAALLTFIDVNEEEINDSTYGMTPPGWARVFGRRDRWWDLPADRHSRGCNLAFADGHTEHWRWKAPKVFTGRGQEISGPEEMKDFHGLQATLRPEYRFK